MLVITTRPAPVRVLTKTESENFNSRYQMMSSWARMNVDIMRMNKDRIRRAVSGNIQARARDVWKYTCKEYYICGAMSQLPVICSPFLCQYMHAFNACSRRWWWGLGRLKGRQRVGGYIETPIFLSTFVNPDQTLDSSWLSIFRRPVRGNIHPLVPPHIWWLNSII